MTPEEPQRQGVKMQSRFQAASVQSFSSLLYIQLAESSPILFIKAILLLSCYARLLDAKGSEN